VAKQKAKTRPQTSRKGDGFLYRNRFALTLAALVFVVFANSIFNQYALDDEFYTAGGNELTNQGIKAIPEIFRSRTFYNNDGTGYEYRPMVVSAFAIEHSLFGQKPRVSHFINVLLYALTIVLLYRLLKKWFKEQGDWFVFFICLLFLAHPLHTEVVDNIKCRDELMSMLGALLCFWWAWKFYETKNWAYAIAYPLAFWFGLLSKRTITPVIILLPLTLYFFSTLKPWRILLYTLPLLISVALILLQRDSLPVATRELLLHENPLASVDVGFAERSATGFYVLGRYLLLHVFPHPLLYYYGYSHVPLTDWSDPLSIASLAVHAALGIYVLRTIRKRTILCFAILFYLISIFGFSNLLKPAPGMMAERFAYMASLGFCIAAVWLAFRAFKTAPAGFRWGEKAGYLIVVAAFLFAVRSVVRNEDWENKMTLYGNDMEHLDESAKAHLLFGSLISSSALEHKHYDSLQLVKYHFRRAVEIYPDYATAWSNLGSTYYFTGEYDSAQYFFRRANDLDSGYVQGWFNLGMTYNSRSLQDSARARNTNDPETRRALVANFRVLRDSAIYAFKQALDADSSFVASADHLSRIYQKEKRYKDALTVLHEAAKNNPRSDLPYINLSRMLLDLKDTALAARSAEMAAYVNPRDLQRLENLTRYFSFHGNARKAQYYDSIYRAEKKRQERLPRRGGMR